MGRHPFAGRYLGKGDMPIERAIAESRFAYSRDTGRTQMAPPPYTPPMDAVGPAVTELFERAFHADARKGGRPAPEAWIDALDALKAALVPCKTVPWHYHLPGTQQCPWCAIEQPTRTKLFGGIVKIATAAIADLETLWARYLALAEPGPPRAAAEAVRVGQAACSTETMDALATQHARDWPRRSWRCSSPTCYGRSISRNHGARLRNSWRTTGRSSPSSPRFGS